MRSSLGSLIRTHGGFFSRAEAIDCGETDRTLANARREGVIVRLRRGMYAPADIYEACDDAGKHLLHARAAVSAQRGAVALAGRSAAALHGFALDQEDLAVVHLVRLDHGAARQAARAKHHVVSQDIEDDLGAYDGIIAVSPARAVWEVACRSSLESGVVTADRRCGTIQDCLNRLRSCNTVSRTSLGRTKESWPSSWPMDVLSPLENQ
jgi:Transcriptional regulator, AbiEi antitoxin